jgi:hypothetical protein
MKGYSMPVLGRYNGRPFNISGCLPVIFGVEESYYFIGMTIGEKFGFG